MANPDFLQPDYDDQELKTTNDFDNTFENINNPELDSNNKRILQRNADILKKDIGETSDAIDSAFGVFSTTGSEERTLDTIEQGGEGVLDDLDQALNQAIQDEPEFASINGDYQAALSAATEYFKTWSSEDKIEARVKEFEKGGSNNFAELAVNQALKNNQDKKNILDELNNS